MKKISLLFLVVLLSLKASADAVEIDGIWYNLIPKGNAAEVTSNPSGEKYSGDIVIPEKVIFEDAEYSVTKILDGIFKNSTDLKSISLPNGITEISSGMFDGCRGLASVIIPNTVTKISDSAFESCSSLQSIEIPNSVTSIGNKAFCYCNKLTSIKIPEGVTFIGISTFGYCYDLTVVEIPQSMTTISNNAFYDCTSLTSVHISDLEAWCRIQFSYNSNPLYFAHHLFMNDEEITDLVIPESVTSINDYAFMGCSGLASVVIPNSVTSIKSGAFNECNGLKAVYISDLEAWSGIQFSGKDSNPLYYAHHLYLNDEEITDLVIPNSVTSINKCAFIGCNGLMSVNMHSNVKYLGNEAFASCINLKDVFCNVIGVAIRNGGSGIYAEKSAFQDSYPEYMTLHVLPSTIHSFSANEPWKNFKEIVALPSEEYMKTVEIDGIWYIINLDTNTAEIIKSQSADYSGSISIQNNLYYNNQSFRVTSIGESAFKGCTELTSISLPYSVMSIGESAFEGCTGLTGITISTNLNSIGKGAFYGCTGLTSFKIPEGVTNIGLGAFSSCSSLTSVIIPSSVTNIESYAFDKCISLSRIVSESEKPIAIDNTVFDTYDNPYNVYSMATLVVPNGTKSVYQSTAGWNNFSNISEVSEQKARTIHVAQAGTLSNYISNEEKYQIEELTLTGELNGTDFRLIRDMAGISYKYNGRSGQECYEFISTNGKLKSLDLTNATIVEGGNPYIETTDFTFARSLTRTGRDYAYYTKDNSISSGLFYRTNLELILIPNSVTSIESSAFSGCSSLTSITIPSSVTRIKEFAFSGCSGLTSVYISDLEAWCHIYFESEGPSDTYSSNPLHYAHHLFLNGEEIKDLVIPTTIIEIGQGAFDGASNLTSVTIHNRVTRIGNSAFYGCSGLTSVIIPECVTTIGYAAFFGCKGLNSMYIPNGVTSIGNYTFSSCSGLTLVSIPNSVTSIGNYAFSNCENVKVVYCYADDVPNTSENAFDRTTTENSTLYVPANAVDAYRAAWPWSDFKEIVPLSNDPFTDKGIIFTVKDDGTLEVTGLEDGTTMVDILSNVTINGKEYQVTSIGKRAFEGRDNIEYLSIPWSVTSIGEFAFIDCGNNMTVNIADPESWCQMEIANEHSCPLSHAKKVLVFDIETDQIDIPESVTSIEKYTFYQCQCIKSLNIPATVTSIGSSAFEGCTGLASLTLSDGLESIGGSAFEGCTGLKNLVIPSTVNTISINAFKNCKEITDVYCYAEKVPNTDENAFDGTPTEKSILHVPASAVESYKAKWPWSDFKEIVAINGNDPDGISKVKQDNCESSYYDLYGRRIHQPQQKGLYIRNGKKIVVK